MQRFLRRLMVFLCVACAGHVALYAVTAALNARAVASCELGKPVDAIILGDSHTAWSIDDSDIEGLRNISQNAEGYRYSYGKLQHLLATHPDVETLYVGFGYHNLSSYFDEYIYGSLFRHFGHRYSSMLDLDDYARIASDSLFGLPLMTLSVVRNGLKPGLEGSCPIYGEFPDEQKTETFDADAMERRLRAQFGDPADPMPLSEPNVTYFDAIVALARSRGIEVVALGTPLHPEYERGIPEVYRKAHARIIDSHQLAHYAFEDLALGDADFLPDGDHTNFAGAVRTTQRFKEYHEAR